MEKIELKQKPRKVVFLLTIPALIFAIVSVALAVIGLDLIPLVPAAIALILALGALLIFRRDFRLFTFLVIFLAGGASVFSVIRGVVIEKEIAQDAAFDSTVNKAQENVDNDLNEAFSDDGFDSLVPQDTPENVVNNIPLKILNGEQIYVAKCAVCHMQSGTGVEGTFPPLAGSDFLANTNKVIESVMFGIKGPITVNGKAYNQIMPSPEMNDEEIEKVVNYIFSAWGNNYKKVDIKIIQSIRQGKSQ